MVDTAINSYPTTNTGISKVYAETSGGSLVRTDITKLASSTSGAATGQTFYVDASGDVVQRTIGSNGAIMVASSGLPNWLAPGGANTALEMVAGAPAWVAKTTPAMVKISSQTVSAAVASVAFTGIPSSGYDHYVLTAHNVVTAAASTTDNLLIQVSTDNGSTYKTTSGDYYSGVTANSSLAIIGVSGNTSTFKYGFFKGVFSGLGESTKATSFHTDQRYRGIASTNADVLTSFGSDYARSVAETDNAFRLISNGGSNITAGTFTLYGVTA